MDSWSGSLVLRSSLWAQTSRCAFSLVWISDYKFVCLITSFCAWYDFVHHVDHSHSALLLPSIPFSLAVSEVLISCPCTV